MNDQKARPDNGDEAAQAGPSHSLFSNRARRLVLQSLAFAPIVILSVVVLVFRNDPDRVSGFGYFGVFLINVVSSGTFLLPVPGIAAAFAAGAIWNPMLVALAGSTGSTVGELSGYMAGVSSHSAVGAALKGKKWYARVEGWIERRGALTVFLFAAIPNPLFDIAGFVAGSLRYPLGRFVVACWVGKTLKYMAVSFAGYWGANLVLGFFS